jgi:hypothetical protein
MTATFHTTDPDAKVHMKGDLPLDIAFGERGAKQQAVRSQALPFLGVRVEEIVNCYRDAFPK